MTVWQVADVIRHLEFQRRHIQNSPAHVSVHASDHRAEPAGFRGSVDQHAAYPPMINGHEDIKPIISLATLAKEQLAVAGGQQIL